MKLSDLYWQRITPLHFFLWPLSQLYQLYILLKKSCYRLRILPSEKLAVPVIMIDRITVNDSALLPTLSWLIEHFHMHSIFPGIISLGNPEYMLTAPTAITTDSDPSIASIEMVLLARQYADCCTIWAGKNHIQSANMLLTANPNCQVIICCNGLHDYSFQPDMKLTILDFTNNYLGNGLILPAGPLRESLSDLSDTTACIIHGTRNVTEIPIAATAHYMQLTYQPAYHLFKPEQRMTLSDLQKSTFIAFSNYEHIQDFSDYLLNNHIKATVSTLPNNPSLIAQKLAQVGAGELVLMPEIDAIRCQDFSNYAIWALPVKAKIDNALDQTILSLVN